MTEPSETKPNLMNAFNNEIAKADETAITDIVLGGEYISATATLAGETSSKPAIERGWLAAIHSANSRENLPPIERLQNIQIIAKEAIKRRILTIQQVNERLLELKLDSTFLNNEEASINNPLLDSIRTKASALEKLTRNLPLEQLGDPQFVSPRAEVQAAIDAYKAAELQKGKNSAEIASEIIKVLNETGLNFVRSTPSESDNKKIIEEKKESPLLSAIRTTAAALEALIRGLNQEQINDPKFDSNRREVQAAINAYRTIELQNGKNPEEIASEIIKVFDEVGLRYVRKQAKDSETQAKVDPATQTPISEPEYKTAEISSTSKESAQSRTENSGFPKIDYEAIAQSLPLNEDNPPKPEYFIQPVVTNMYGEDDEATLAGRLISDLYDNMVKRPDAKPYTGDEVVKLIEISKENRDAFQVNVEKVNVERQKNGLPPVEMAITRGGGKDGFHFNGDPRASQDFLYYFNKSKVNYKHPKEPEIRAYISIKPEERLKNQEYFVELAMRLYDAGIDFSGKAGSIFGVTQRMDNMVFYISVSDQPKASQIIKAFLQEKSIGQGKLLAALPSPQDGLSWAMEPTKEQMEVWKKISGSSKDTSFNVFVSAMTSPAYMERVAAAHRKKGNIKDAEIFEAEAKRVRAIIENT
jgi:hypothetical protein